jgi:ATP-dependent helicase HrpB
VAQTAGDAEGVLLISILTGYPDRVARRREGSIRGDARDLEVLLAGGGAALLAPESVVRQSKFLVAVDAEERRAESWARGRGATQTVVRVASAIEPEWLLDLFADGIEEADEARWNAREERVEVTSRLLYDGLVLDERRGTEARGAETSRVLAAAALDAGVEAFADGDALSQFLARVDFVARTFPEAGWRTFDENELRESLLRLCEGRRSFAELRDAVRGGAGLVRDLRARLSPQQSRLLADAAPERIALASGRQTRVRYERGRQPWIASRLQDFFGMRDSPRIAAGRVAVVLHLLAPSQRPVQVTTDLAGFWARHYPQLRRELSRRYPRHDWREDPLAARPPAK